ncbi:NAD(P)-binding domain-containing protein [Actinomadura fulvescens]|uniref:Uncharacterized protein n=1 Tax=Actinomadura fulvescens TaxID=46160 RepID=A0ABP6BS09_9ACTN
MSRDVDVVVVGAGQAGLSAGYFLRRAGLDFVMFDHAPRAGGAWQFRWPTLTLGTAHNIHDLPGMPLEDRDPERPASEVVSEYFGRYEREFGLRVHRPVDVTAVREGSGGRLLVESSEGVYAARTLINATGTWDRPFWPFIPGMANSRRSLPPGLTKWLELRSRRSRRSSAKTLGPGASASPAVGMGNTAPPPPADTNTGGP